MKHCVIPVLLALTLFPAFPLRAEGGRTVTVIVSTDNSGYNLASALQYAVAQLFREAGGFNVQVSAYSIGGFTPAETQKAHRALQSELFSFAFMDRERISIFLFDEKQPGKYLVGVNPLLESPEQQLSTPLLEARLRKTFSDALALYRQGSFSFLPGADKREEAEEAGTEQDLAQRQSAEASHLFRELASLSERPFYLGANLGMARYSSLGSSESLVSIGGLAGYRWARRFSTELSVDIFNYGLLSIDTRYHIPLARRYVFLSASLGGAMVLFQSSSNFGFNRTPLATGTFVGGPGFSFEIPLLGANIRGSVRYYLGSVNLLLSSYGVSYSVSL